MSCLRDDNLTTANLHPDDECDLDLMQKSFYVIMDRHLTCVPSFECVLDAVSRFYRDCG